MNKTKAFTLVELVVATSILTIAVFSIYKLISENNKTINNSNVRYNSYLLFPSVWACIDNLWINEDSNISFGNNLKECLNSDSPTTIDNIDYHFKAKKLDEKQWEIQISSDFIWTITWSYIQN